VREADLPEVPDRWTGRRPLQGMCEQQGTGQRDWNAPRRQKPGRANRRPEGLVSLPPFDDRSLLYRLVSVVQLVVRGNLWIWNPLGMPIGVDDGATARSIDITKNRRCGGLDIACVAASKRVVKSVEDV